ncbi:hypothetical protein RE628_25000 [Paenibacillus sp. D2_2]|uniref:hypothetical protein n=1 Tax=Paenibacillus sp. D2_2 TaxID=3073092 RepID=UPI002815EF09|nr:hypothetical protein [Paenibacillus sp. D2_2]WMT40419.1 hypothetical protein RE628_25000 [Paenibacillus sp. D2_2]
MKLRIVRKKSKWFVYQKVIAIFILLLLPLITMNIWFNYKGMSISKDAILSSSLAGATFYSKQLDKEMYFIRNLQLQLLNDKDLQKLSFRGSMLESYEEVELVEQVRDRQNSLTAFSDYIVNAGVYVEAVGKTISTMSGVTNTPNPEMSLVASLISTKPRPSFYQTGNQIFLIETENNGGYGLISRFPGLSYLRHYSKLQVCIKNPRYCWVIRN